MPNARPIEVPGTTIDMRARSPMVPATMAPTRAAAPNAASTRPYAAASLSKLSTSAGRPTKNGPTTAKLMTMTATSTVRIWASAAAYRSPAMTAPSAPAESRSVASERLGADRRTASRVTTAKAKVAASMPNPRAEPAAAIATPARAGPTMPVTAMLPITSAFEASRRSSGTSRGTSASAAGWKKASAAPKPTPSRYRCQS